jgi:hypothetical protein
MHVSASVHSEGYGNSMPDPYNNAAVSAEEMLNQLNGETAEGSCSRGLLVAGGIEAGIALLLCALWQAWRYIH